MRYTLAALLLFVPPLAAIGAVAHSAAPPAQPAAPHTPVKSAVPEVTPANAHWLATGLTSEVDALLEAPQHPGRLLAGTTTGIWLSDDGGSHWRPDRGSPKAAIAALAGAPHSTALFAGDGQGYVYMKHSLAQPRWQRISPLLENSPIFSLAVSPSSGAVLAGTNTALFRGTEQGGHWRWQQVLHTDLSSISTMVWTPWAPHIAYAAVFGASPPVEASSDDGRTWHAAAKGLPPQLPNIALIAPQSGARQLILTTMGDGVWRYSSGTWREISAGLPERHAMPVTVSPAGTLFAGTMGQGAYMKRGNGAWQRAGTQMIGGQYIILSMITAHGARPAIIAGTSSGIFRLPLPR